MKHYFRAHVHFLQILGISSSVLLFLGFILYTGHAFNIASATTVPALAAGTYCQGPQPYQPTSGPSHVIDIMLENESSVTVSNSPDAPFENNTLNTQCGTFSQTSMHSTTHGSESNYLALTSGVNPSLSTGTDALTDFALSDCPPTTTDIPASSSCSHGTGMIPSSIPSLYSEIEQQYGVSGWKDYSDNMPTNCDVNGSPAYARDANGTGYDAYVPRHNPAIYYQGIACSTQDVPSGNWQNGQGALYNDLMSGNMPYYSFIEPNDIENGHDPVSVTTNGVTTTIAGGISQIGNIDTYLSTLMPIIQASPQYQSGSLIVMITFDEGIAAGNVPGEDAVGEQCANPNISPLATSCQVKTWIVGRYVPNTTYTSYMNEFGLLAATQRIIGVSPLLNHAADASTPDIVNGTSSSPDPFNLAPTASTTTPGMPLNVIATPGNGSATVSFSTPFSSGGAPITKYTVTSSPGNFVASGVSSPITVNGLTNGVSYTFTVTASNIIGTGPSSSASAPVTPAGSPLTAAPTGLIVAAGNDLANLSWTAPTVGGTTTAVTDYLVRYSLSGANNWTTIDTGSTNLTATVSGLTDGVSYDFDVIAVNGGGSSAPSTTMTTSPSAQLLPDPGFETSNGGWIAFSSGTLTRVTSPIHGGQYALKVTAPSGTNTGLNGLTQNAVISNSVAGTSYTSSCYVMPTLANTNLTYRFLEYTQNYGTSYKSPVTTVTSLPLNTWSLVQVTSSALYSGDRMIPQLYSTSLTTANGGGLLIDDCSVTAGSSVTLSAPRAPTAVSATSGNGSATVSFTAPSSNGGSAITSYTVTGQPGNITATTTTSPVTITGLTNGTSYTFTVTATNNMGTSSASTASSPVIPATSPGVPTNLAAAPADGQVRLSWQAPLNNGGAAITQYMVGYSVSGAGIWSYVTSTSTSTLITGLSDGTSYDFEVSDQNSAGGSVFSNIITSTPVGLPGAPTGISAVAGNQSATISFTAPASNGGNAITGYTVTSYPGNVTSSGAAGPLTVAGLINGQTYTFTVTAATSIGTGSSSQISNSVTPSTVPDAPSQPTVTPESNSVNISWNAPFNEGSSVTDYILQYSPSGANTWTSDDTQSTSTSATISGLTSGNSYDFEVSAVNANGQGNYSTISSAIPLVPATVPTSPTNVSAVAGDGSAVVTFTASSSNGGSAITEYAVTSSPDNITAIGTSSPISISGLTDGTSYTFTVTAMNSVGSSVASSPSLPVTPMSIATIPTAPTSVNAVAGDGTATVSFNTPSSNGGNNISEYTVTSSPGNIVVSGPASPLTITGLTDGTPYTFTVVAINGIGSSPSSTPSNTVTPEPVVTTTVPSAPQTVTATSSVGSATVSFIAPANNGNSPITGYIVTSSPGNIQVKGTSSPITVAGLVGGTGYTFTVVAVNAIGSSLPSASSNSVTPNLQLLPDPGFESGVSGWVAFTSGVLTRVTTPVHGGSNALEVAAPATGNTGLVGITQNTAASNTVAGKTYTASCYVMPLLSSKLNLLIRFLEYTQNYSSNTHLGSTQLTNLPLNTWTQIQVSSVALNSGDRMIPQLYSTNETTATGGIIYDDCSLYSN